MGIATGGRTLTAALVAVALGACAIAPVPGLASQAASRGGAGCTDASKPATHVSAGDLRKAIQCLVNAERAARGRSQLGRDRRLARAARRHTTTMIQANCLGHLCGGEPSLEARIRNTGYLVGARRYDYAEDVGCEQTAQRMVSNWMHSPIHRENLLNRKFKHIGVAASHDRVSSRCTSGYVTFTAVFAHRKR